MRPSHPRPSSLSEVEGARYDFTRPRLPGSEAPRVDDDTPGNRFARSVIAAVLSAVAIFGVAKVVFIALWSVGG